MNTFKPDEPFIEKYSLTLVNNPLLRRVFSKLKKDDWDLTTPDELLQIYRNICGHWKVYKILEVDPTKKTSFLSPEFNKTVNNVKDICHELLISYLDKYEAIWEKWMYHENMTTEKKLSIWRHLPINLVILIWWEFLCYKEMTNEKIEIISFMLWEEDITKIWPQKLALMNIKELNELV